MAAPVELAPDYYLRNFQALVDFVVNRYEPLLSAPEREFYRTFKGLEINSQRLYVRLLSRKGVPTSAGALFRQSKLAYAEIDDLAGAAERLVEAGLLWRNPPLPPADLLPLFSKAELLAISPTPLPRGLKRQALEERLLEQGVEQSQLLAGPAEQESLLAVQGAEHFRTFKLCFFGNLRQDLTDYVLRDLGLYRFEAYPLDQECLPFQSRAQIEQHLRYYECLDELESALNDGEEAILALAQQLPPGIDGDATLHRRLDRLRLTLARQLERLEALQAADRLYRQCHRPPARERRARIAVQRGDIESGLALCREIIASPHNEAEQVFAESFGYRTAKRAKRLRDWQAPERYQAPTETVALPPAPERVELMAAAFLQAAGSEAEGGSSSGPELHQCFYVENTLFKGVLGLFVWDILFAPVPGAFFNPFQAAPSDFRTPDFYPLRRAAFERRLSELKSETLAQRVWLHYREKWGLANPLVAWEALSEPLLELALARIPPDHWRQLFRRLLNDIEHHRNGLPDLILFPAAGSYELVEVKGPGDRLQQNQQRWLAFFARHQIPHRVLHVEWEQP
ncbi:VRR-NUC domain-containing protein [Microbulbifer flavimaris]|uniref:phosphodiesterase I n=1 Tax=Microbulbifer flavimaris TaxID=1781068 RepID=A0ABX4HW58_9GAMM|nr:MULTISPECIES: VRR-NUC domain-containing protein [Microbulbifer]KUJ80275.1 VRR-NUC domain-containing protein [Microbulbifer sp. ZGT114]PCO04340.1 VRR-NUC domain-containing protein [Microbulbifer flavimaris]